MTKDDNTQVQRGAENHMEVLQDDQGNVQVQGGPENRIQLSERDTDVRQPFRQG